MNWTTEKPTAPGWYWYRERGAESGEVVEVAEDSHVGLWADFHGYGPPIAELSGEFAGPILTPERIAELRAEGERLRAKESGPDIMYYDGYLAGLDLTELSDE